MDRSKAESIYSLLSQNKETINPFYSIEDILPNSEPLSNFHQWANEREFVGGCLIRKDLNTTLWILFLLWNEKFGHYMVIFPENKSGPLVEIHKMDVVLSDEILKWNYKPTKRDQQNKARKEYFRKYFQNTEVNISVPKIKIDLIPFLDEIFSLTEIRLKADALDPNIPNYRDGFPEGKLKEKMHKYKERNSELTVRAKRIALEREKRLICEICGFDFEQKYGEIGKGFIEAHHTVPISKLSDTGEETRIEDIALVCSNCHRMLHRKRPWLEMSALSNLINN